MPDAPPKLTQLRPSTGCMKRGRPTVVTSIRAHVDTLPPETGDAVSGGLNVGGVGLPLELATMVHSPRHHRLIRYPAEVGGIVLSPNEPSVTTGGLFLETFL